MQVSVEESGAIERKLTVAVPHAEVDAAIQARLAKIAAGARLPGFRPGKAPKNIIEQKYSAQITEEAVSDAINKSYHQAIEREKLTPAGVLDLKPQPYAKGEDLKYVATIEIFPKVEKTTLAGRKLEKPVCEIGTEDVERTLENIRKQHCDFTARGDKSQAGDRLTVDFAGAIDGKPFRGGTANAQQFILGEGRTLAEFEKQLQGVMVGDEKNIKVKFPKDYPAADLADKNADFKVKVVAVDKPILPELNDAFAAKLGIKDGGMKKMREEIKANMQRELLSRLRVVISDLVLYELLEINKFAVPKALVEAEIDRRMKIMNEQLAQAGKGGKQAPQMERQLFAEEAERQVKLTLIGSAAVEEFKLKPDAEQVDARIKELAEGYEDSEAMIKSYNADPARRRQVEGVVLHEQMINSILSTAEVREKVVSFSDLMQDDVLKSRKNK